MMTLYRGFSTADWINNKTFKLNDIELVKRDLLNHIWTIRGERVNMPSFGTRIPLMTFEQADETTRSIIEEDLKTVIEYDPRVSLISMSVVSLPNNNAILAMADLFYLELKVNDVLRIEVKTS
jgi:phage baseplate assembly protein W